MSIGIRAPLNLEMKVARDDVLEIGLCLDCVYSKRIDGKTQTYYLCERSFTDPNFPKYPRLPVRQCSGYEQKGMRMKEW